MPWNTGPGDIGLSYSAALQVTGTLNVDVSVDNKKPVV